MHKNNIINNIAVFLCLVFAITIIVFLQCINPFLYDCDGYYHIKAPYFIREFGLKHDFPWAQFSTFKKCFSDKELLFHLLILPFTYIGKDFHMQARFSVIFFVILFFITFIFIQKKYVLKPILCLSVLSLPLSMLFLAYINYLRPKTLAVTFILILIYFLIEKRWIGVFIISIIYSLTHISFVLAIALALGIEILRYIYKREFYVRNLLYSLLGIAIGIFIHPNFPNNFVSFHLNAILVPWNTMLGNLALNYGLEWNPANTKIILLDFLPFFAGLFFSFLILLLKRINIGFHTIAFFFSSCFFVFLSMFSICYWYFMYPLGIIFLAMFFSDILKGKNLRLKIIFLWAAGTILIAQAFLILKNDSIKNESTGKMTMNSHYERIADWMNKHIPAGEIIYHTSWSDSPYFICLNPKDYYLTMLDPIYMYYYDKNLYNLYNNLSNGLCNKPAKMLKKYFKSKYGYTGKGYGLYNQIKNSKSFKILFEDDYGAIFQLVKHATNEK